MLEIYVFGQDEQGFLEIDPGTVLEMESTLDMWDEDLTGGEFSLPIDIPWTGPNRRKLGFSERLENFKTAPRTWRIIVYDSGFAELPAGKLTLQEKSGNFSYTRGKFSATISGTKGLFGTEIKTKKLGSLNLGTVSWSGQTSRQFATSHMSTLTGPNRHIAFAPVAIEDYFDEARPDYDNEFLVKDTVNYMIEQANGTWAFARPQSGNALTAAIPGTLEYIDYRTIPFLQLKYVLKKIFEDYGYTLTGDFITSTDFDKLYLFNNVAIEAYSGTRFDFNDTIIASQHLPDMLISDFLRDVFLFFNLFPVFTSGTEVKLYYRQTEIKNKRIVSMNEVCSRNFTSTYQDAGNESGYALQYNWDGADSYYSDRVKDITTKTLVASVAVFSSLATLNIGRPLTTEDIAYIEADNMYYLVADSTSTPIKWDAWAERLQDYTVGAGERTVNGGISPLCTYVEFNSTTALYEKRARVGTRQPGTYINNKGTRVVNAFGLRLFYIDSLPSGSGTKPVSFCHNRDAANNRLVPYSLSWHGPDGMATLHTAWQQVKDGAEVVKTEYTANQRVIADIEGANCHEIGGIIFLPKSIERTIPLKKTLTVSLVPL